MEKTEKAEEKQKYRANLIVMMRGEIVMFVREKTLEIHMMRIYE